MVTARERYLWRRLRDKFGIKGEIAGRYIAAGYGVRRDVKVGNIVFDILAAKEGEKLAIKVFTETKTVSKEDAEKLLEAAEKLGAKLVLVLYGSGPRISGEALEIIRDAEACVRRIRPR